MTTPPAVEFVGVSKSFGEVVAVEAIDLEIGQGEFFSLLGPSGCGKTTTLRMIAGFEFPTTGILRIDGRDMTSVPAQRRNVNLVFQSYALFPHLTVAENVAFGLRVKGVADAEVKKRAGEALAMVQLDAMARRKPRQLSGGQQQRVALARALVNQPAVLLLDEPLGALDQKLRKEMQFELKRLQREVGITFVYVTHDQEEALTMSDRVAVMNLGRVLQVDAPAGLYDRPESRFVADFIGSSNFLQGTVTSLADDVAEVAVPGVGVIRAKVDGKITPGVSVAVMIRPERLRLGSPDLADNTTTGRLEDVVFVGNDILYRVGLEEGTVLTVRDKNLGPGSRLPIGSGQIVSVSWPAAATNLIWEPISGAKT
ncbi:MAG: ABC transporter ATP-binding protein [Actinomycetota bacterium]